jgi:hypothetical protein
MDVRTAAIQSLEHVGLDPQARGSVEQIIAAGLGVRKAKTCLWRRANILALSPFETSPHMAV